MNEVKKEQDEIIMTFGEKVGDFQIIKLLFIVHAGSTAAATANRGPWQVPAANPGEGTRDVGQSHVDVSGLESRACRADGAGFQGDERPLQLHTFSAIQYGCGAQHQPSGAAAATESPARRRPNCRPHAAA